MNWYKYWYYTIYFIYDHFSKNAEDNKIYSIGFFSLVIYMLFTVLGCFINNFFDFELIGYIAHPFSHLIFILITFLINNLLFDNTINARKDRMLYKEFKTQRKNVFFNIWDNWHINIGYFKIFYVKNKKKVLTFLIYTV